MEESELVQKASRGDQAAIDILLERHLPTLRAFVRLRAGRLIRAKESHSDIVQSVCREVLQAGEAFEYRGEAAFKRWLCTTALRKLVERQRYYGRDKRDAAREASPGTSDQMQLLDSYRTMFTPSRGAVAREELQRLEAAFDELPEHYREVIIMDRMLGIPQREIAEHMGKTEVAVQRLLTRALVKLSGILQQRTSGA
jgi:RNA polymerase sigma-70 factor (ECF subfamily)